MKPWYQSKLVWLGVLECAIGILGLVAAYLQNGSFTPADFVLLVSGALTVVLRVFFTDTAVG